MISCKICVLCTFAQISSAALLSTNKRMMSKLKVEPTLYLSIYQILRKTTLIHQNNQIDNKED